MDSKKKAKANPLKGRQESLKEGKDEAERQILEDLKNEDVKDVVRSETKGEVLSTLNEKVEINKLAGKSEAVKISTKGRLKVKGLFLIFLTNKKYIKCFSFEISIDFCHGCIFFIRFQLLLSYFSI